MAAVRDSTRALERAGCAGGATLAARLDEAEILGEGTAEAIMSSRLATGMSSSSSRSVRRRFPSVVAGSAARLASEDSLWLPDNPASVFRRRLEYPAPT